MFVTDFHQPLSGSGYRFIPSRRMQQTIGAANQRFGDAVGVMNKIVCKTAFDAQISIVYHFIILHMQV